MTVAAGVTTEFYESKLPAGAPVIRVMPNAPVVVGGGVSALAPGRFATAEQLKEVSAIFDAVGGVLTVPESQMDAVTAVSGSGPAYFFLMVEALVDAGVAAGLSRPVATDLVVQTMAGSAAMLLERLDAAQPAGTRRWARRWTPPPPSCAPRSPRRAAQPPLVCGNSKGAGCGPPWPRPLTPQNSDLSSSESHPGNSTNFNRLAHTRRNNPNSHAILLV